MAGRLRIGVDIDGVLSDFRDAAGKLCVKLFNDESYYNRIVKCTDFDSFGLTKDERKVFWKSVDEFPNWWMTHIQLPYTYLLDPLCNKHRVIFITNRKDAEVGLPIEVQSKNWLMEVFGLSRPPNVIISDNKGPVALGLGLNYFIDDRPKNIIEVQQGSPDTKTFIYDAEYNQDKDYGPRVKDFNVFASMILEA